MQDSILRFHVFGALFVAASSATASNAADATSKVPRIVEGLTTCVGHYEAAKAYSTYVKGYAQGHKRSTAALERLLVALQITDTAPYQEAMKDAASAFQIKIFEDPLNTRAMLSGAILRCDPAIADALALSLEIENRDVEVAQAERSELQARLAEIKAKQDSEFKTARAENQTQNSALIEQAETKWRSALANKNEATNRRIRAEHEVSVLESEKLAAANALKQAESKIATLKKQYEDANSELRPARIEVTHNSASDTVDIPKKAPNPTNGPNPLLGKSYGLKCDDKSTVSYFGEGFTAYLIGGQQLSTTRVKYEIGQSTIIVAEEGGPATTIEVIDSGLRYLSFQFDDIIVKPSLPTQTECIGYRAPKKFDIAAASETKSPLERQAANMAIGLGDLEAVKVLKDRGFDFDQIALGSLTYMQLASKHEEIYKFLAGEDIRSTLARVYDGWRDNGQPWVKISGLPTQMQGKFSGATCDIGWMDFRPDGIYQKFLDEPVEFKGAWGDTYRSGNYIRFEKANGGSSLYELISHNVIRNRGFVLENGNVMMIQSDKGTLKRCPAIY